MDSKRLTDLSAKVGGLFKLTVLLQKRIRELVNGAPKLVDTPEEDFIEIALMEVEQDKIILAQISDEEISSARRKATEAKEAPSPLNPLSTHSPFGNKTELP